MFWRWQGSRSRQLDRIEAHLRYLVHKEREMANIVDDLKAAVAEQTTVVESTRMLLKGLHDKLVDAWARQDLAAIPAILDSLRVNTSALSTAVAENTVAASEPTDPAPVDAPAAPAPDAPAPAAPDAPSA
jgi:uncharacterized coiled-coil protein SlyX